VISIGNGWSFKTQVGLGTPFDPQRGRRLLNATESTIGGVGLPPLSLLEPLVNPGDSRLMM